MARAQKAASEKAPGAVAEPAPLQIGPPPAIVMLTDPAGATAEAVRALRTRIQSQHLRTGRRALAVCGPAPEVGCTFVAVNLSVALAQIGIKTLLVEADLRTPTIGRYFAPGEDAGGLRGCLMAPSIPVSDFIQPDVLPNLDIMFAGEPDPIAHELLSSDRFPELINTCMRDYDITIVDTPPANSCADGLRVSTVVGFSLIVARKNKTLVSDVRVLIDELYKEGARPIGTVLDDF